MLAEIVNDYEKELSKKAEEITKEVAKDFGEQKDYEERD